jgi:hypothetical protein
MRSKLGSLLWAYWVRPLLARDGAEGAYRSLCAQRVGIVRASTRIRPSLFSLVFADRWRAGCVARRSQNTARRAGFGMPSSALL